MGSGTTDYLSLEHENDLLMDFINFENYSKNK